MTHHPTSDISYRSNNSHWMHKVNLYIRENLANPQMTVADMAAAVFVSERQFYRRIKKLTGKTPNHYLQSCRLQRAKELLESDQFASVKEVATAVGYSRSDYFSRLFEARFGIRPSSYFR
jgi:transcriptional regulator GlxA family with amidase domain